MNTIEQLYDLYGKELVDKELELENESLAIAKEKFLKDVNQDITSRGAGKNLLKTAVTPLAEAIDNFLQEANSGKSGRKHSASCLMGRVAPDTLAYITLKVILQSVIKETFFLSGIALSIASEVEDELRFSRLLADNKQVQVSLSKRVGESYKKAYLRSVERAGVEEGTIEPWEKWDKTHKLLVGIKLVELAALSTGIVSITLTKRMGGKPEYQVTMIIPC